MLLLFQSINFNYMDVKKRMSNAIGISAFLFYRDWDIRRYNYTFDRYFIIPIVL